MWLLTDKRLTTTRGFTDDGLKTIRFSASDGAGLIGYAGLGRTAGRRQPSDWIKDQLVGVPDLTTEDSLHVISEAVKSQLREHLRKLPPNVAQHDILAPAIVEGETRLYHIGITLEKHCYVRLQNSKGQWPPRVALAGSGAAHLTRDRSWLRPLLRLLAEFERGRLNPQIVADRLAELNAKAADKDIYVSKQCIVTWQHEGGSFQHYDGTKRVRSNIIQPVVDRGVDFQSFFTAYTPFALQTLEAFQKGDDLDVNGNVDALLDALNGALRRKPKRDLK